MNHCTGWSLFTTLASATLLVSCTASIEGRDGNGLPLGAPPILGAAGSAGATTGPAPQSSVKAWPSSGLRRLTRSQYLSSVQQLLGTRSMEQLELPPDEVADEGFEFRSVGASRATTAALGVSQYDALARALAGQLFADNAARSAFVGCAPSAATDACVTDFLKSFGRRALRHPLTSDELTRYAALVSTGTSSLGIWRGLEAAVAAFLSSPAFLYRVELGSQDPASSQLRLDDFELATRLSYLLTDSTPDDALLDAAASGELANASGLDAQVSRLMSSAASQATLTHYFSEWLGFQDLASLPKDAVIFPSYTAELAQAMGQELDTWVSRELLQGSTSILSLYTTQTTYVNAALARHYGIPAPSGTDFEKVTFPPSAHRGGLLTFAGLLAGNSRATMTSPTLRGRYIRERLLCGTVPPPPANVKPALPPPPPGGGVETMRQRLKRHATDASCSACHSLMDPLGLALEHYDAIGAYRELDQDQAIDASGTLDGVAFADALDLGQKLAKHPDAARCVTRQLARHAWGQPEIPGEEWVFDELSRGFEQDGYTARALVQHLVEHTSFRFSGGLR